MQELKRIETDIMAKGKVDSDHLTALHAVLYADKKIDRAEADFVVALHKKVQHPNPAFERLVYSAVKSHVLSDGTIDAEEAAWLRQMIFADGVVSDQERKFLNELKGEAKGVCPEFEALFKAAMEMPENAHTSGSGR